MIVYQACLCVRKNLKNQTLIILLLGVMSITRLRLGSKLGAKFSLGGHCVNALRLAKVLGNLAQAKTGSTQDPICI